MRAGDRRRLDRLERSLARSRIYAPEPLSDAQLIEAMKDGTATLAHMKQVYDICARDLEIRLFQEAKKRRDFPDIPRLRSDIQRFGMAAEILRFRATRSPGSSSIGWGSNLTPGLRRRRDGASPLVSYNPPYFSMWARAVLLAWLLDRLPGVGVSPATRRVV